MAKSILVVDDSGSVRNVVSIALRSAGYEVVEAGDGLEGMKRLDGRKLHLIISDVNMPRMDGISFLREVKKHPQYKYTPVMMLTTEAGDDRREQGRTEGAKAWMTKPFQPEKMLMAVQKLVLP